MKSIPLCPDIPRLNGFVIGYHATSVKNAAKIVNTQQFKISKNRCDWLGQGVYFWKNDKQRARYWGQDHYGKERYAILEAKIKLGYCLSLLETSFDKLLEISFISMKNEFAHAKKTLPTNKNNGRYDLDCAIF